MVNRIGAATAFGIFSIVTAGPLSPRNYTNAASFKDIPPSPDLKWTPCYGNFTCVNLEVPLDYENPTIGTTNVAFIRWSTPKQPAMGDIIMNPGGPGGSAVEFILSSLDKLTSNLGTSYNIVGMDPRGVNNSGPSVDCFKGEPAVRDYYNFRSHQQFEPRSNASMDRAFVDAGAFGDFCSVKLGDEVMYANTPAVAHDMLHYAELLAESKGQPREDAKLDYYGVSYGSALGTTFAALYPDRVGRMIIDGVMDVQDYYDGSWIPGIQQADDAIRGFCDLCFEAGPKCAFYANDSSGDAIQARLDAILEDMERDPIPVSDLNAVQFPTVVSHMHLRSMLFSNSYDSFGTFPILAEVLAQLEARNGTLLAVASGEGFAMPAECDNVSAEYSFSLTKFFIGCTDQMGRYNISTTEEWYGYFGELVGLSRYLGAVWSKVMTLQCRSLRWSPPESQRFYGMCGFLLPAVVGVTHGWSRLSGCRRLSFIELKSIDLLT
jgi:pimeloyl-ACP methyl ester carboxylesterase